MTLITTKSATVEEALETRITARAFLDRPVPDTLLRKIFEQARRAPSGGNIQPWNIHVLTGDKLRTFVKEGLLRDPADEAREVKIPHYPEPLWEPKRSWRSAVGKQMYTKLGIGRDDIEAREDAARQNVAFFGAPVGIIITGDERYDVPQYIDIGIYLQTVMLLARSNGLHTAPQGWWRMYPKLIRDHLEFEDTEYPVVGMSLGWADPDAPVNSMYTQRAPMDELVTFYD